MENYYMFLGNQEIKTIRANTIEESLEIGAVFFSMRDLEIKSESDTCIHFIGQYNGHSYKGTVAHPIILDMDEVESSMYGDDLHYASYGLEMKEN